MSDSAESDKQPEEPLGVYKCKELIHDIFLQSGSKDRLMAHIRHRTAQQGWTWTMRDKFMEYIKKRGPDNVNVSHMIADLAPVGRDLFPSELKKELVDSMFEATKNYFTIDDTITPLTDPDNANSEAEKTFLYQSRDVKPDPGLGIGVEMLESPPPSPANSNSPPSSPSETSESPSASNAAASSTITTTASALSTPAKQSSVQTTPRQSPHQHNQRQSPGASTRHSPATSTASRPKSPSHPLPPPPVLKPETPKTAPVTVPQVYDDDDDDQDDDEDDEEDDEDARTNDDEDELMDV